MFLKKFHLFPLFVLLSVISVLGFFSLNVQIPVTAGASEMLVNKVVYKPTSRAVTGASVTYPPLRGCENIISYTSSHVTRIDDVTLHPELATGNRRGGESVEDVKGQAEEEEYFRFKHGFLEVLCVGVPSAKLYFINAAERINHKHSHLEITKTLVFNSNHTRRKQGRANGVDGLTVAISRQDYANMYWTTLELYSAYFAARELNTSSLRTTILLLDAHPMGHLDGLWDILFKRTLRIGWLSTTTHFDILALVPPLKLVPIVRKSLPIPYMDDFRHDVSFLAGCSPSRKINCKKIRMTLIVRRNYVAHPRNSEGKISRQLKNANEIIQVLKESFSNDIVQSVSLEDLSVQQQVKLSCDTDILLGVHGAGLAHAVFQVPGSGLIEFFPREYKARKNPHFEQLAKWSGKLYASWYSEDDANELHVPLKTVVHIASNMKKEICKKL